MSKKNEVTVAVENTEISTQVMDLNEWGNETDVSSKDLVIPRVWLMQALSELVAEKEVCKAGDLVCSLTENVLGDTTKQVAIVPFKVDKLWYVIKDNGDKGELIEILTVDKSNENLPLEFTLNGEKYKRQYVYKFYVLLEGSELPYTILFKGTSLRAGKQMFTEMFIKNKMAGKSPAAFQMLLSSEKQKNEKGVFYILKIARGQATSNEMHVKALEWFKTLRTTSFKEAGEETVVATDNSAQY